MAKNKIKGPITFQSGKLPQKFKDWVKKGGIGMPFDIAGFEYKNVLLDSWLRIKKGNKKYKYDRSKKKWEQDQDLV